MKKSDENSKQLVQAFLDHFVYIKQIYYSYKNLFEDDNFTKNMQMYTNDFFCELNGIYINLITLLHTKIMDPEYTGRENNKNYNLTVDYIINNIEWTLDEKNELLQIKEKCARYIEKIKPARNKVIAHNDIDTYMASKILGAFEKGLDTAFLKEIELFCNIITEKVLGRKCGQIIVNIEGDVQDFKKLMNWGIAINSFIKKENKTESENILKREIYNLIALFDKTKI